MPGDIPNKKIQDIITLLKSTNTLQRVDKVEKDVSLMVNMVLELLGNEMYPEDRATDMASAVARVTTPQGSQARLLNPSGEFLKFTLAIVQNNDDAQANIIGMKQAKSFIRRSAGKKVVISDQDAKAAALFLYGMISQLIVNAAVKTQESNKVVMTAEHFANSIRDDGSVQGRSAVTNSHELLAVFQAKKKSLRIMKSKSKSKKARRHPPNCKKNEISVNGYSRSDGKSVAGSCRKKKSKTRSRKSKSRSSKRCSAGKHYRKGYKSSSGKRVKGKCVKNKSTSR